MSPFQRGALRVFIVLAVLLATLVLVLAAFDLNWVREPVARRLSTSLERPVRIAKLEGRLLSLQPRITVSGLELGNPRWAPKGETLRASYASVRIKWLPLLGGNIELTSLDVRGAELNLLRDARGKANWQLGKRRSTPRDTPADFPLIHHVSIENARVRVVDEQRQLEFRGVLVARERTDSEGKRPFEVHAEGELNGEPFEGHIRGESLAKVRRGRPYSFDIDLTATNTRLIAEGTFGEAFNLGTLGASVRLSGYNLADLYYLTGLATPQTPPYRVTVRFGREGALIHLRDLRGRVGDSDVRGDVSIDVSGTHPNLKAVLVSKSLDLDDLGVLVGAPPPIKVGETASPQQVQLARELAAERRVLSDKPFEFDRMRRMDASVQLTADTVMAHRIPLKQLSMRVALSRGQLVIDPLEFDFPQGRLAGYAWVNSLKDPPETDVDVRLSGVRLEQFKPKGSKDAPLEGTLLGRTRLRGVGYSLHDIASSANGSMVLVIPRGEVREAFVELTGINVARGLGLLLGDGTEKTGIRCGLADFDVKDGTLRSQNIVFDTDDVRITGKGDVSLKSERFNLTIQGRPKELRFFRVKAPIAIRGPLRHPDIGVDAGGSVAQGGLAAALGALTSPIAAIVAFVDPGLEKDANCAALMSDANKQGAIRSDASRRPRGSKKARHSTGE
jgi:uncharacterized protein involved in outer membrane biogenesis